LGILYLKEIIGPAREHVKIFRKKSTAGAAIILKTKKIKLIFLGIPL
jgi:hypothetical protein